MQVTKRQLQLLIKEATAPGNQTVLTEAEFEEILPVLVEAVPLAAIGKAIGAAARGVAKGVAQAAKQAAKGAGRMAKKAAKDFAKEKAQDMATDAAEQATSQGEGDLQKIMDKIKIPDPMKKMKDMM